LQCCPLQAQQEDILSYLEYLTEKGYEPSTRARHLSCLKQFYKFLKQDGDIKEDPTLYIDTPQTRKALPKILSIEEVEQLIAACSPPLDRRKIRLKAILETLYATGLRVSELVMLPLTALDMEKGLILVTGKGSKQRYAPLG